MTLAHQWMVSGMLLGLPLGVWGCASVATDHGQTDGGPVTMPVSDAFEDIPPTSGFDTSPSGLTDVRPMGVPQDGGPPGAFCMVMSDEDHDHDGYSVAQGDCNDCDKHVNPGALDVPGNKVDEDCSGVPDDEPVDCEQGLLIDGDAVAAARALGICRMATADAKGKARTWGLLSAAFVFPDGSATSLPPEQMTCRSGNSTQPNALSHGILASFGPNVKPRQGEAMAALSSGVARAGLVKVGNNNSPNGASMCTASGYPTGFPVSSVSTCGDLSPVPLAQVNDAIALELVIRAPANASAFAFDFDFYTYEFSEYVCSDFNDAFVALLYSKSPDVPANHDIAFDSQGNPVSVNNGFVEVCRPYTYRGTKGSAPFSRQYPCKLGTRELVGTGFDFSAATGWMETHANIVPGEDITLRFAIWDAGDDQLDSTVLLDKFRWSAKPGTTVTMRPPDIIVP